MSQYNELTHAGVLGMRWGVRKNRRRSHYENARRMSSNQLRKRINRLQMEENYVRLKNNLTPKSSLSKAAGYVGTAIGGAIVSTFVNIGRKRLEKALLNL